MNYKTETTRYGFNKSSSSEGLLALFESKSTPNPRRLSTGSRIPAERLTVVTVVTVVAVVAVESCAMCNSRAVLAPINAANDRMLTCAQWARAYRQDSMSTTTRHDQVESIWRLGDNSGRQETTIRRKSSYEMKSILLWCSINLMRH